MARKLVDFNPVRTSPEAARLKNPKILYHIKVEDITTEGIRIVNKQGNRAVLAYDTLIISRGRRKNDSLFEELSDKAPEAYKIGDCLAAGNILKAIRSANEVARTI